MTRDEYIGEFHALRSKPILGTHTIGVLTLTVGPRNWTLRDSGPNTFQGPVKKGPETRERIHTALMKWLDASNVR
ncbi:MAG: hypothetical protein JNJ91_05175 [Flavobacteriales bacterium]|nr:hypothetical protein [Flavobacteriales bacterium]